MKLVILGNGFDLYHGYKTSFVHFSEYLESNNKSLYNYFFKLLRINIEGNKLNWNNFEKKIGELFLKNNTTQKVDKEVYQNIELFSKMFYDYLNNENIVGTKIYSFEIDAILKSADCILTFNYTNTYRYYFGENHINNIFHIHGKLARNDMPIIGYFYNNIKETESIDYIEKFSNKGLHKPALAYKQNEINFSKKVDFFVNSYRNKIDEIVSIGYSFGDSDDHIYEILHRLMVEQINAQNIPNSTAVKIPSIKFRIFEYDKKENELIVQKIKNKFKTKFYRHSQVNITGTGEYILPKKDLLLFETVKYESL